MTKNASKTASRHLQYLWLHTELLFGIPLTSRYWWLIYSLPWVEHRGHLSGDCPILVSGNFISLSLEVPISDNRALRTTISHCIKATRTCSFSTKYPDNMPLLPPKSRSRVVGDLACQRDSYLRTLDSEVTSCIEWSPPKTNGSKNSSKNEGPAPGPGKLYLIEFTDSVLFPEGIPPTPRDV
jgi:hypothetical protein